MPRGKRFHARVEPTFVSSDPRYLRLTPGAKTIYMSLWCTFVEFRKETVQVPLSWAKLSQASKDKPEHIRAVCKYIATMTRTNPASVTHFIREATAGDTPLIRISNECHLTLCGLSKLHPGLCTPITEQNITEQKRVKRKTPTQVAKPEQKVPEQSPLGLGGDALDREVEWVRANIPGLCGDIPVAKLRRWLAAQLGLAEHKKLNLRGVLLAASTHEARLKRRDMLAYYSGWLRRQETGTVVDAVAPVPVWPEHLVGRGLIRKDDGYYEPVRGTKVADLKGNYVKQQ